MLLLVALLRLRYVYRAMPVNKLSHVDMKETTIFHIYPFY
jgi:hypothetical protein